MARDVQQSDYSGDFNSVSCYDENIYGSKYLIGRSYLIGRVRSCDFIVAPTSLTKIWK